MNILKLVLENLRRGTLATCTPAQRATSEYRGLIVNDSARCVGCGQCAYVCPSGGMEVHRDGENYEWIYDPGKCTFCARCIDRCKLHTLTMQSSLPPIYSVEGELKQEVHMVRKRPVRPPAIATKTVTEVTSGASDQNPQGKVVEQCQSQKPV